MVMLYYFFLHSKSVRILKCELVLGIEYKIPLSGWILLLFFWNDRKQSWSLYRLFSFFMEGFDKDFHGKSSVQVVTVEGISRVTSFFISNSTSHLLCSHSIFNGFSIVIERCNCTQCMHYLNSWPLLAFCYFLIGT